MLTESVGTGVTATLPLVVIALVVGAIFVDSVTAKIVFVGAAFVWFATTVSFAVWYFNQSFSLEGMGWWYGGLAVLTIVCLWAAMVE